MLLKIKTGWKVPRKTFKKGSLKYFPINSSCPESSGLEGVPTFNNKYPEFSEDVGFLNFGDVAVWPAHRNPGAGVGGLNKVISEAYKKDPDYLIQEK
jgi:hypothetical protein